MNQLVAMRMMMGRVARDGIKDANGALVLDPAWIDNTLRAYRGDSQGGIMGGTYMAISTDVTRGLLGEPGTPYSVLLNRSKDSILYNGLLRDTYKDDRNVQIMWSLIQLHWDRTEPSGFVPFINGDTLPGTPEHQVLLHDAIGDHQVTTLGAHIVARAVGAKLLKSNDPSKPVIATCSASSKRAPRSAAVRRSSSWISTWRRSRSPTRRPPTAAIPTTACECSLRRSSSRTSSSAPEPSTGFATASATATARTKSCGCPESFASECPVAVR